MYRQVDLIAAVELGLEQPNPSFHSLVHFVRENLGWQDLRTTVGDVNYALNKLAQSGNSIAATVPRWNQGGWPT